MNAFKPQLYIDLINMTIFVPSVLFSSLNNYRILCLEESRFMGLLVRISWRAGSSKTPSGPPNQSWGGLGESTLWFKNSQVSEALV